MHGFNHYTELRTQLVRLDFCTYCEGVWCDAEELNKLLMVDDKLLTNYHQNHKSGFNCPACGSEMLKTRFQGDDNLELDVCSQCKGIWLDKGELETIEADIGVKRSKITEEKLDKLRSQTSWLSKKLNQISNKLDSK